MITAKLIGTSVKKYRLYKDLSQMQLELLADLSLGTVSRIENGHIMPSLETLLKIIKVLKIDYNEIIVMLDL